MPRSHHSLLAFFICSIPIQLFSQDKPRYELGLSISSFIYQGDLTPERLGAFRTIKAGIQVYASKMLSPTMALRANIAIGSLYGDDNKYSSPAYRQQRNFTFKSPVAEVSGLVVYDPLGRLQQTRGLSTYVFTGVGLTYLHIRRDWSRYNAEYFDAVSNVSARLQVDAAHALPRLIPVIPAGLGMRYRISERLAVGVEGNYRFSFTDYLDGFSRAANPARNDHYMTVSAGMQYRIGKKDRLRCPRIER